MNKFFKRLHTCNHLIRRGWHKSCVARSSTSIQYCDVLNSPGIISLPLPEVSRISWISRISRKDKGKLSSRSRLRPYFIALTYWRTSPTSSTGTAGTSLFSYKIRSDKDDCVPSISDHTTASLRTYK